MSRLGEIIKKTRLAKGITTKQLAKKCGVAESFILDAESGRKIINEALAERISKVLDIKVNEVNYDEQVSYDERPSKEVTQSKKVEVVKPAAPIVDRWEDAFSTVIKKIPVYSMDGASVLDYKSIPTGEKKIEGYNSDKISFVKLEDDSLSGFRLRKGDIVMVASIGQITKDALNYIEYQGRRMVRQIKVLDAKKVLLISHGNDIKTLTAEIKDIKIIGLCIKAEIYL